jgi:hypothetical protein
MKQTPPLTPSCLELVIGVQSIYEVVQDVAPQIQPKPRGIQGNRSSIQLQETAIHHD